jgi:hypothetical protein
MNGHQVLPLFYAWNPTFHPGKWLDEVQRFPDHIGTETLLPIGNVVAISIDKIASLKNQHRIDPLGGPFNQPCEHIETDHRQDE